MLQLIYMQEIDELLFEILAFPAAWAIINRYQRKGVHRAKTWVIVNWLMLAGSLAVILKCAMSNTAVYDAKDDFVREFLMGMLLFAPLGASISSLTEKKKDEKKAILLPIAAGIVVSIAAAVIHAATAVNTMEPGIVAANILGSAIGAANLLLMPAVEKIGRYLHQATEHD